MPSFTSLTKMKLLPLLATALLAVVAIHAAPVQDQIPLFASLEEPTSLTASGRLHDSTNGAAAASAPRPGLWALALDAWTTMRFFSQPCMVQSTFPPPLLLAWNAVFLRVNLPSNRGCALSPASPDQAPFWTTEYGKHRMLMRGQKFIDVTDAPLQIQSIDVPKEDFPSKLVHGDYLLGSVFPNISISAVQATLQTFTSFHTRHYRMSSGRDSQKWLLNQVEALVAQFPEAKAEVREIKHPWGQNSIVARIPSHVSTPTAKPVVILGAHQDSTNMIPFFAAPGADDDGSGTATIFEALRALLSTGWVPQGAYDVEWHWYSAEEGGLLGSQEVVREYVRQGRSVRAMLQQDMTAYVKPGSKEQVGLVTDFTDPALTSLLERLIDTYLTIPWAGTQLGYAGSDHASWSRQGVPATFAIEGTFDDSNLQAIHSTRDLTTIEGWSWSHLEQFVRLSTAFVVELAGQQV